MKLCFSENKTLHQCSGANSKNVVVAELLAFSLFFRFLEQKVEKECFDQPLDCSAPKDRSKYTTAQYYTGILWVDFINCFGPYAQLLRGFLEA